MTALPPAMGSDSTTGTNEPTTHISWSCVSKRANARPWSDSRTWRCTNASNEGLAMAPASPTAKATTASIHRDGKSAPSAAATATNHRTAMSICCSLRNRRARDTRSTPTSAPAVRAPSRNPNHHVAAPWRRSPKAMRNVTKPTMALSTDMGTRARFTSVPASGRNAAKSSASPAHRSSASETCSVVSCRGASKPATRLPRPRTGRRNPAATAATKTTTSAHSTLGEPPSL